MSETVAVGVLEDLSSRLGVEGQVFSRTAREICAEVGAGVDAVMACWWAEAEVERCLRAEEPLKAEFLDAYFEHFV